MSAVINSPVLIRRYIEVQNRPTVVRLDELEEAADWITSCFYLTRDIQEHLRALSYSLERPSGCGIFLVGQYGSGKSHWLAYVTCQLRNGMLVPNAPEVVPLSLLNFRATTPLEDIVCDALGVKDSGSDRRNRWAELQAGKPNGLLLILDELSEFLRSKPDLRAFNEDVRFLQYMGEWAQAQRFWVVAAMQEGIEHTGQLEHGLYRKIKDRFPMRFLLSPSHVKDLIQQNILIKKEGCHEAVDALVAELEEAVPDSGIDYGDLRALYPVHPATLELLEDVRDRFSQARGVVDFIMTQLNGDSARGITPFLDQPWGSLLTPDLIIDHFRDLFELQPEFVGLAQQFFPHYRRHLSELFPKPSTGQLAERLLNLLVLVHLSPAREGLSVREAASWLLFRASRIDPQKNSDILSRILGQLVERGRYVVQREGRFHIELRDDGMAAFEAFLDREKQDLKLQGETVLEQLLEQLDEDDFNPLRLAHEDWQQRTVRWHFHERQYSVFVGNEDPPPLDGVGLCIRLPWGSPSPVAGFHTVRPAPLALGEELLELAALLRSRTRPWGREVTSRLEGRLKERLTLFKSQIRAAFRDAEFISPAGDPMTPPRSELSFSLRQWLDNYAELLMRGRYPAFERFAPGHGPLPKEAYRSLMRFVAQGEMGDYDADEFVKLIREAYLVPMRLLTRQGRGYVVPANLERHELVTLIRPLLDLKPSPALIYENAAQSIYGLVPDQIGLMLVMLHILGELDILKSRRSYRELYETLPDPLQYEQVVPCSALNLEQLKDLQILFEGLQLRGPKEWTVLAQRRAVRQVKEALTRQTDSLRVLLLKIQAQDQAEELAHALRQLLSWVQTLQQGNNELDDLQQFLFEIGSPRRFLTMLAEVRGLPERLDRVLTERKRYQHLFHHPSLAACLDPSLAIRIDALQTPPSLDQLDLVEQWLHDCRAVYEQCKQSYQGRHEAWWHRVLAEPIWNWQPPLVASSRHLGLEVLLQQFRECRQRAERLRCSGLVNLDFQPLCACGFDGQTSPVEEELARLKGFRDQVEHAVSLFYRQESVRERVRQWVEQGLESNPRTRAYLQGDEPYPETGKLELLDRHLAGVELVKEADLSPIVDLLCERTWEKDTLIESLKNLLNRLPAGQLRFRQMSPSQMPEVVEWSVEQCLRYGVPLPQALRGRAVLEVIERIRPEWVGPEALARIDDLGLGTTAVERIIRWLLEGQVAPCSRDVPTMAKVDGAVLGKPSYGCDLLWAALEILQPHQPDDVEGLAKVVERLYRSHDQMLHIAGARWLDRLDALARTPLPPLPSLSECVTRYSGCQYVLLDCVGIPLLGALLQELDSFLPAWHLVEITFGLTTPRSTTDACYEDLVAAGFRQKLEKINGVDRLVHDRFLPFEDFARLAMAELAQAFRSVRSRLDQGVPLLVFPDHGFRIARDGQSYCHGSDSTLERIVPVFYFEPR